jgi:hypothetical protein
MSLAEIAQRMGCSHAVVASINRRYEVREYEGRRDDLDSEHQSRNSGKGELVDEILSIQEL